MRVSSLAASTNSTSDNSHPTSTFFTAQFDLGSQPPACLPSSSTFQLMEIVSDKQDLSFVQKVQVSEAHIAKLCNLVVPCSAKEDKDGRITHLDFNALNTQSAHVVGFYGEKAIIAKIFRKEGLAPLDFLNRMEANLLTSGLYASTNGLNGILCLLYWDGRQQAEEASRKDVSCNFVRYLEEICETVYVCLEGKGMEEATIQRHIGAGATERKRRTQRLQVATRKESENKMRLVQGFSLQLPCGGQHFLMSQGLHRCVLLVGSLNPCKVVGRQESKTEKPEKLKEFLNKMFANFAVDCKKLPDDDFILLLKILNRQEELQCYNESQLSWKEKETSLQRQLQNVQLVMKNKRAELMAIFSSALECFLVHNYAWEESLVLINDGQCNLERIQVPMTTEPVEQRNLTDMLLVFEGKLCHTWSGHDGQNQRFLFPGAVEVDGFGSGPSKVYNLSIPTTEKKVKGGFISYGQHVMLTWQGKDLDSPTNQSTVYFSEASSETTSPLSHFQPIILSEALQLLMTTADKMGQKFIVSVRQLGSGMEAFLSAICENKPLSLRTKAAAASYLINATDNHQNVLKNLEKLLKGNSLE
ncbi:hypothetical protein L7F22_050701 [Adiantum nelumboides]|nr:hypothetical protein [Adiantum nelumboides]